MGRVQGEAPCWLPSEQMAVVNRNRWLFSSESARTRSKSSLAMAAPGYVFTIRRVAKMLGEYGVLLHEIGMGMEPEDGRLSVLDLDDDASTVAFLRFDIENLKELLADRKK
jgi:hypothetical protein